jgi:hypothetical protein
MTCSYAMEGCVTHGQTTNFPEATMTLPPEYFLFPCSHQAMPGGQGGNGANCCLSTSVSLFIDDHSSTSNAIQSQQMTASLNKTLQSSRHSIHMNAGCDIL